MVTARAVAADEEAIRAAVAEDEAARVMGAKARPREVVVRARVAGQTAAEGRETEVATKTEG